MLSVLLTLLACKGPATESCPIGDDISADDRVASCAAEVPECAPSVLIGSGVGGIFQPFADGDVVTLDVAPQGGFGVTVKVRSQGLVAGDDAVALIVLDVEQNGENIGTHRQPVSLLCQDSGEGEVFGVVVGFDPAIYSTNDDLLDLDGAEVTLVITLEDEVGTQVTGSATVVVDVGG